jgi:predicted Zn finger-like uncharacterized protein
MIVSCPACSTRYLLEPAALGASGRTVRCAKCEHSWHQGPPSDMPREVDLTIPPAGSVPLPSRVQPAARVSRGAGLPLLILVLLVLGVAGGYFFRERIIAEWPKTAQIYELLGLPTKVVGAGLELDNVNFTRQDVAGQPVIQVQGDIFNKTDKEITLPPLKVALQDDSGKLLSDWTFGVDRPTIRPGETIAFKTETKNPPPEATKLTVTFAGGS